LGIPYGDISDGKHGKQRSGFEATPILVDGTLFFTTGFNRVIAVNPETGKLQWAYDPKIDPTWDYGDALVNRGVATWLDAAPAGMSGRACHRRIYEATLDARLIALDAGTGAPCADFGENGEVSLRNVPRYMPGRYHMTSPPVVIDDLVVVGSAINDNNRVDMPSGVVRAFDARTGALRWSWHPIEENSASPADSKKIAKTWETGAGNAWSIMTVDTERDLVFIPTGSASPDYYGGLRLGDDKWANSVVALRGKTGKFVWGFQLVHHDHIPRDKLEEASRSGEDGDYAGQTGTPYGMYRRFLQGSSDLPCSPPPWGMLSVVDMNEGKIKWQIPLGSMQYFGGGHSPIPPGSIGFGGPVLTASGLVFIAGTFDPYIRAFDVENGKELWEAQLPAAGNATPMTYSVNGKQYLVIAAGGHPKITEEALSDTLISFSLP
jgi:glucose dehydrogenase